MCGIFSAVSKKYDEVFLTEYFEKIRHRGPDHSELKEIHPDIWFGFHRLAINGLEEKGNQPMHLDNCCLIANAEIFNYKELAAQFDITLTTGSDCEILIHLYRKVGIEETLKLIDAEFAFVLYDELSGDLLAARDHLGIRGMYIGKDDGGEIFFASEAKALVFCKELKQFPPACWWTIKAPDTFTKYYELVFKQHKETEEKVLLKNINYLFTEAVKKRMMSERPIGCLLSGGLDSSLVTAIAAKHWKGKEALESFSIGLKGSPDLASAQVVADHIGTRHHHVELEESDFLSAIDETIYMLGSYDVTTIRASVGHMLIARYVRDHSDVKVLFSGETADEFGSYLYFQNAPGPIAFQQESIRLLEDIQYFDMKRGDRSISYAGIEARIPFADKAFMEYYMSIDPKLRMFGPEKMEKYLIRKAFSEGNLLPEEILWRRKNGFSDSVSNIRRSWSTIIQEAIDRKVSDEEFEDRKDSFGGSTPHMKEAYYYRKVFTSHYGKHQNLTPYQWLPKWCGDVTDPSARVLSVYAAD